MSLNLLDGGKMFGWAGTILHVNLENKQIKKKPLDKTFAVKYLGGKGFSSRLLYELLKPGTDPFSPDNPFILSVGPFAGSLWPTSSRFEVSTKSPLTNTFGCANSGGHLGPELKFAGYDAIVFEGISKEPVYLHIEDDSVKLSSANDLWGKTTAETEYILKKDLGDMNLKVATIGPAGERLVLISAVINDYGRAAARGGPGAIMGNKKLKAVAIRGTKHLAVAEPDKFFKLAAERNHMVRQSPKTKWLRDWGTLSLMGSKNAIGDLPTKNRQTGQFALATNMDGPTVTEKYAISRRGCYACPIACSHVTEIKEGPFAGTIGEGPEYETTDALGPNCFNGDFGCVAKANKLCNHLGLDTMSTGVAIGFAMELWEKGILTPEDVGGLDLTWGNTTTIISLIEMIASRQGLGAVLAEGVKRAAEKIGKGAEYYAMHVKGMELATQEGRTIKAFGLAHATGNRGADHLYALPTIGYGNYEIARRYFPHLSEDDLKEFMDLRNYKFKALQVTFTEKVCTMSDSLSLCKFSNAETYVLTPADIVEGFSLLTGIQMDEAGLLQAAERIVNLERCINARDGYTRKDDTLPRRLLEEPYAIPGVKPTVVELDALLDEYYILHKWNVATGLPTREKLEELGLEDVAEDLAKLGEASSA
ncbi:MAG TPA: aldehyde ferredoxin oxidoreductase family protein [Candidatus Bathyarchaeia archaeon]|nr:aldehyde ferredoxin oxidoreductase family protein [Candidatus Bathyarchaeia archaeon]